jgi:hypothetical protein
MSRKTGFAILATLIVLVIISSWGIFQMLVIDTMANKLTLSIFNTLGHIIGMAIAFMLLTSLVKK